MSTRCTALLVRLAAGTALLAVVAPGCILNGEDCGVGLHLQGGRCFPDTAGDGGIETDDAIVRFLPRDAGSANEPPEVGFVVVDAFEGRDAGGLLPFDSGIIISPDSGSVGEIPWERTFTVLVTDRTPEAVLGETPSTPGCDLDGVSVQGDDGFVIFSVKLLASEVFDPFDQSVNVSELDSVGPAEETGERGTFVSLGGDGAYQLHMLEPPRPLRSGDLLLLSEVREPNDPGDQCAVWLCASDRVELETCRWVGEGGVGTYFLR